MPINHVILSGAGPNGLIQLGALSQYHDSGRLDVRSACGCSSGAMLCALLALRVPLDSVVGYIIQRPWNKFLHVNWGEVNAIGGVVPCDRIHDAMRPLFLAHGVPLDITFQQAFDRTGVDLYVVATSLKAFDAVIFNHKTHPNMPVLTAVAASAALPPIFAPCAYEGDLYIDGGVSLNFPFNMRWNALQLEKVDPDTVLSVHAIGACPTLLPSMTLFATLSLIMSRTIVRLSRIEENDVEAAKECSAHYLKIPTVSHLDQKLWELFVVSEAGRSSLVEQGRAVVRERLPA